MQEVWMPIPGYEGKYEVSNLGNVKSLKRKVTFKCGIRYYIKPETMQKPALSFNGYKCIKLCINRKYKSYKIHQLVAMAFLGHKPCGHQIVIDHIDNNKLNNNLENLRLVSHRENSSKETINKNGFIGVRKVLNTERFIANIYINKKQVYLGTYDCPKKANEAYLLKLNEINNQINK